MMEERDQEHRPESQQIYDIGFPILLHFAGACRNAPRNPTLALRVCVGVSYTV
jgi:hypothetical protein